MASLLCNARECLGWGGGRCRAGCWAINSYGRANLALWLSSPCCGQEHPYVTVASGIWACLH